MTKPFNPKDYKGKNRIFKTVSGTKGIQRIWCWNHIKKEYIPSKTGHLFLVKRYENTPFGGKKRISKTFPSLIEARSWQSKLTLLENPILHVTPEDKGPLFKEIYEIYWKRKMSKLSTGTQQNHKRYAKFYLHSLMNLPIREISSTVIDNLLDIWRSTVGENSQSKQRISFKHELSALRSILIFYREYYDDASFHFPLKFRHAQDVILRKASPKHKDLNEEEFLRFCEKLKQGKWGNKLVPLAIVQYYQALRISEVAALRFEDLNLNFQDPAESSIRIYQHVVYPRVGGVKPKIIEGYKNSTGGDLKELPLFYPAFKALENLYEVEGRGLIFGQSDNEPLPYRVFQAAYNKAFMAAHLPYRSTHVLRHGGTRRVYNSTNGDLAIAQQLLGNTDLKSTLIYAKRDKGALRKVVKMQWSTCNLNEVC